MLYLVLVIGITNEIWNKAQILKAACINKHVNTQIPTLL